MARLLLPGLVALIAFAAALPAVACDDEDAQVLTVFAATSLSDAFEALAEAFEQANPGVDIRFDFAGSEALAARLRDGARADIVALGGSETMQSLAGAGLVRDAAPLTSNVLVVATRDGLAGFESVEDLARGGLRIAMAAPAVDAGRHAREVLDNGALDFGEAWRERVLANVVGEELSVRAVLERIERGDADAGFAYRSDFTSLGHDVALGLLPLPARLAVGIVYPAALTARPAEIVLAQAFLEFMFSDDGQAIIESFGLGTGF